MAYSQGGLILATDYNNFLNGSNQLNTVWSTGTGNVGYGQTALSTISTAGTVTATQWATLINTLNSAMVHQTGTGSGISATTAGGTINYLSTLANNINTLYPMRFDRYYELLNGSTTTGNVYSPAFSVGNQTAAYNSSFTRTIAFESGDAARYFFNAGGYINFITTSAVNNDATSRSADMVTLIGTNLGNLTGFGAFSVNPRSGTGGTFTGGVIDQTNIGYYQLTTSPVTLVQIVSTSGTYSADYVAVAAYSSTANISGNGDKGSTIYIQGVFNSGAQTTYAAPGPNPTLTGTTVTNTTTEDSVNVTWNHRIDIVYPESTNLSAVWGNVTVT